MMEGDVLSVRDTGQGIRHPKRAFERHYKEGERGMGLGLHIVQRLCRELGIGIALESEVGRGTIVKLECARVREK
jgi:signal transduction histidine kinase